MTRTGQPKAKETRPLLSLMIVDDHRVVREGTEALLRPEKIETDHKCGCAKSALERCTSESIDVILMDVRLPDMDGLAALERMRRINQDVGIVMFSAHDNITNVARAVALGADEFVDKGVRISELAQAIRHAAGHRPRPNCSLWLPVSNMMRERIDLNSLPSNMPLTSREAQVLRHMGLGLSNREIAFSLSISVETVKEHVQNVLRKMNAADRTDAAVRAVRAGLA